MSKESVQQTTKDRCLNESINKTEIKFLDNKSDKKISADIDKLNESLYKINNFLKLTKDIDDLKKENLVKNDIQRKLSLKSQWLNNSHGSTASLNSLPAIDMRSSASESSENVAVKMDKENVGSCGSDVKSLSSSIQNLNTCAKAGVSATNRRANFLNHKSASIQNLNLASERRKRFLENKDELNFIHSLDITDKEIEALRREPEFGERKFRIRTTSEKLSDSMKKIELQSFSDTMKNMQSQCTGPRISTSGSQRDLSKYFPKKNEKVNTAPANKNQKELKDVDLTKYFTPSPVQELKSIPSPGQSPNLPRKMPAEPKKTDTGIAKQTILREAIAQAFKVPADEEKKSVDDDVTHAIVVTKPAEKFNMFDQQLDGAVMYRKRNKVKPEPLKATTNKMEENDSSLLEKLIDTERSPSREYSRLFDNEKSPDDDIDDIDELFEQVAAKLVPELPKLPEKIVEKKRKSQETTTTENKTTKKIKSKPQKKTIVAPKKTAKQESAFAPAPTWYRKSTLEDERDAFILSKLSSSLIDEIKMLEEQLSLADTTITTENNIEAELQSSPHQLFPSESDLDNAIDDIFKKVEAPIRNKSRKLKKAIPEEPCKTRPIAIRNIDEAKDDPISPKGTSRKNSVSYDLPVSSPPGSRKASILVQQEKPKGDNNNNTTKIHKIDQTTAGKDSTVEFVENSVEPIITKPPRSRKNSTAEPVSPKIDETKNVERKPPCPFDDVLIAEGPSKREPQEWNVNGAYEPKAIETKLEGYDTVDKSRAVLTSVVCPSSPTINKSEETKKIPPPKPIRRNKSSSSFERPKEELEEQSKRKISYEETILQLETHASKFSAENIETPRDVKNPTVIGRNTDFTAYRDHHFEKPQVQPKVPNDNNTSNENLINSYRNSIESLRKSSRDEKRGINISELSKRRKDLDLYQHRPVKHDLDLNEYPPKPQNSPFEEDRPLTGFIPQDNLRNRHANLSNAVSDTNYSRPNNDLTGLLNNLSNGKNKENGDPIYSVPSKKNEFDHLRNASPRKHSFDGNSAGFDRAFAQSNIHRKYDSHGDINGHNESRNDLSHQQYRSEHYKYGNRGIYDNIPSSGVISRPFERTIATDSDYYSSSSRRPSSNDFDYDNLPDREPIKPARKRSVKEKRPQDTTEKLLERSKMIHNKKQEFMDERIIGNNPYLKRMFERESRENLSSCSSKYDQDPFDEPSTSYRPALDHTYLVHQPIAKTPSTFSLNKKKGSNKSLNSLASTKKSVLDLFKKSPEKSKDSSSNGKDGCSVS